MYNAAMNILLYMDSDIHVPIFPEINIWDCNCLVLRYAYLKPYCLMPKRFVKWLYNLHSYKQWKRLLCFPFVLSKYGACAIVSYLHFLHYEWGTFLNTLISHLGFSLVKCLFFYRDVWFFRFLSYLHILDMSRLSVA